MDVTLNGIEVYLSEVKEEIRKNRYRLELNSRRQDNRDLFLTYVLDETMAKDILLGLTATDFSEILQNEHKGYEHELLYVFGKDIELLERMGNACRTVSLYIKFNKMDNCYVIIVSLHEQKYPINYYFK
ncbi:MULTISPECIES: hypothetical protein [unclassified Blautia]|uniref:hypothetical protein n=1 Tax=unclassified Blautia TaxID=2648079 RepID=UPI003F89F976